ncbi:unnamed protein product [Cuscuta campestris]|uniref:Leucine-rich repeat-containing N-terminal plant-type domain-containing protein n=1 Tax=Cuscuta campestris TaxID=132261 RepID=A0A484MIS3_9ASTE|nr:unnamed protein product [Cuscuta campestris]
MKYSWWLGEKAVQSPAVVSNRRSDPLAAIAFVANMRFTSFSFLLLTSFLVLSSIGASGNSEVEALDALRKNLGDPNLVLQSWDSSLPDPCLWYHITCNSDNSVTRIDLGNAGLSGQLVPELGNLTNLQYLGLYANNIGGEIPMELGNLENLISLDLYDNSLNGSIPHTLGQYFHLRFLRLQNNRLIGTIPKSLITLYTLEVLDLSNNKLTGPIPTELSLITSLKHGDLSGNCLDVGGNPLSSDPRFILDNNSDPTRCA